jgi:hypothetical protein
MEVISESFQVEKKEQLPQILMRIFNVCKADPNFPLKEQIGSVEDEIGSIEIKLEKQDKILEQTIKLRDDLSQRLQNLRRDNFELKSKLLEELGSEI